MKALVVEPACGLDEIAAEMGISKERVRQIQESGLAKLRQYFAERDIELRDLEVSSAENPPTYREIPVRAPHTLPPRIHAFTPIALPDFPLPKE